MMLTCGCEVLVTNPARMERACEQHGQISLRDHFAGQALVGLLSQPADAANLQAYDAARWAYWVADAMISAREGDR